MRLAHFFIDRPIFAAVLSMVIVILGAISYWSLPAAQYPEVVPPTIMNGPAFETRLKPKRSSYGDGGSPSRRSINGGSDVGW